MVIDGRGEPLGIAGLALGALNLELQPLAEMAPVHVAGTALRPDQEQDPANCGNSDQGNSRQVGTFREEFELRLGGISSLKLQRLRSNCEHHNEPSCKLRNSGT